MKALLKGIAVALAIYTPFGLFFAYLAAQTVE